MICKESVIFISEEKDWHVEAYKMGILEISTNLTELAVNKPNSTERKATNREGWWKF